MDYASKGQVSGMKKLTAGSFPYECNVLFKVRAVNYSLSKQQATYIMCCVIQGDIEVAKQMIFLFARLSLTPHAQL